MDLQGNQTEFDPVLSPEQMASDAGISRATWFRNWRRKLPIVWVSQRRVGCRQSAWRRALAERTEEVA